MRAAVAGVVACMAGAWFFAGSAVGAPAGKLAPNDIKATFFNGQPFIAATTSNIKFKMTFSADGKMKRVPASGGARGEGTWKLSKDGFCSSWKGAKENLLHRGRRRRQQMVGDARLDHHGDVEQISFRSK